MDYVTMIPKAQNKQIQRSTGNKETSFATFLDGPTTDSAHILMTNIATLLPETLQLQGGYCSCFYIIYTALIRDNSSRKTILLSAVF